VAGCDGFHGVSRDTIPAGVLHGYHREFPFAWLGILAAVAPSTDELIYAYHDRGFALHSLRSPDISRLYLQVRPDEDIGEWPDDRIWEELRTRLASDDGWTLTDGPVIEKSIHQFVDWIREEVAGVGEESRQQSLAILGQHHREDNRRLVLPTEINADVTPKHENGQPIYSYHDLQFQPDHDEIMQLLMGDNLYGDPGLCIRELLQNALDAVELILDDADSSHRALHDDDRSGCQLLACSWRQRSCGREVDDIVGPLPDDLRVANRLRKPPQHAECLVLHLVTVAVGAVQDVARPSLPQAGDVGELVAQP
jgi:hypothetical protein